MPDVFDRRGFLVGAAATGLALAGAAAGGTALSDAAREAPEALADATGGPTPAEWARFSASLTGYAVRRGQPAYGTDRLLYNPKFDGLAPLGIAYCASTEDVVRALAFARSHSCPVAVRAGGHSYGGYSSGTGRVVVDVTSLRGVVPAAAPGGTARVGAGARLIDVYNTLGRAGQLVPAGSCPTVGF
ncbi:MAG TPA: FAD-dependent oxidoreductase, partial [Acidimicrobiales bacterium]|nr:FAD-dependent oxidoreductase [Acidimicrobiales bacterium]